MNILLDESAPRLIKARLSQYSIRTVQEMGWTGMRNGELLAAAEGGLMSSLQPTSSFAINRI